MKMDLSGKIALVTGAGVGIGREAAIRLAECGAKVAVHVFRSKDQGLKVVEQIRKAGGEAACFQADLTKLDELERMVTDVENTFGDTVDILFNNSGGLIRRVKNTEMDEETYNAVMDVNFKSLVFTCKRVLPGMIAKKRGKIINMASLAAHDGGGPGASIYAASKGAVISYSKGLAKEVAPHQIHVNAIAPGFITDTPFHATFTPKEAQERMKQNVPLGRAGYPVDVAGVVLFLASSLSDYLTGETIEINGGLLMR